MDISQVQLHQRIEFWSRTRAHYETGTVLWISPRRTLVAVQVGTECEFLTPDQLQSHPLNASGVSAFLTLPPADPQDRPDQERYLRVLASAYPRWRLRSLTLLEGVRTSAHTGQQWRVFCQAAVLEDGREHFLLDLDTGPVWCGGVQMTEEQLTAFCAAAWVPRIGIPNQWDAVAIPASEMSRILSDVQAAVAAGRILPFPSAVQDFDKPDALLLPRSGGWDGAVPSDRGEQRSADEC